MAVRFGGLPEGNASWSVDEDATSLDRADSPAGVPVLSITSSGSPLSVLGTQSKDVSVESSEYGRLQMVGTDVALTEDSWTVEGGSPLHRLVQIGQVRTATKLRADQAIERFFASVGIGVSGYKLIVDPALSPRLFEVPAWNGVVWGGLRQWLSANELDLNYIVDTLYLYPMRNRTLYLQDLSSGYKIDLDSGSLAKTIEVNVYHREHFNRGVVYPGRATKYPDASENFSKPEFSSISVEAGQVSETTLQLAAEVNSIRQPTMVTAIPVKDGEPNINLNEFPNGIYMIVGKDNKRIMPSQWADMGGGLSVKLNDDHRSVTVRVTGMLYKELSPYRVAESDGSKDYNGLFLVGDDGQYVDIETVRFDTGVGNKTEEKVTISNTSITDLTQAYHAAQAAADRSTGQTMTLDWNGPDPVRSGFGGIVRQAFGRIPGTRFLLRGHWWRAKSSTFSEGGVSISGERDTTVADINRRYNKVKDMSVSGKTLRELSNVGVLE